MRHERWIGWWQPGHRCGRCCCWASGSMSPKANGGGRHGWRCGCSRFCPISVGWKPFIHGSTIVLGEVNEGGVPVAHARGKRKVEDWRDKEIQRRALRLYWPASRCATVYVFFLFFSCFRQSCFFSLRKGGQNAS